MKKKYIFSLVFIGIMFLFVLTIGTGYGLWIATKDAPEKNATTLNCFKVYFSNSDIIEMKNVVPVINDEGIETSPNTLTITNICEDTKELQVRLNILDETTIDIGALTIQAAGNIEKNTVLYKNLSTAKTIDSHVTQSKLIGLATIKPNETVRTNIKLWFDEKKAPNIDKEAIFKAKFELIDTESSIKATFAETLLNNQPNIENKQSPSFADPSFQEEGLYILPTNNGNAYYYRGIVTNNYVKFANLTWRIVGINSDNSVKIVLDKSAGYGKYSDRVNAADYTGSKYVYNDETINNSINNYLLEWYEKTINYRDLDKYVTTTSYCNDSNYSYTNYHTYFNGYNRIINEKSPSLTCPATNNDFGGTYNQKIGLLTADEVVLAGGGYNVNNFSYYLYNGENFFTMTPAEYFGYVANVFTVNNSGSLQISRVDSDFAIRPVLSLTSTITVSGSGTQNDPYTIDEN